MKLAQFRFANRNPRFLPICVAASLLVCGLQSLVFSQPSIRQPLLRQSTPASPPVESKAPGQELEESAALSDSGPFTNATDPIPQSQSALSKPTIQALETRLANMEAELELAMKTWHVPGMAIAIVHDDKVVFTKGFGWANIEDAKPVGPETLFAIGSTSKAFTTTLAAMLVDEGTVGWDDEIRTHLEGFTLPINASKRKGRATLRDAFCHRTGFTRMNFAWSASGLTQADILEAAARAEPTKRFRRTFQYNNVLYLAGGLALGSAGESTWDKLVAERIFAPLGMTHSVTSVADLKGNANLAQGYKWGTSEEKFESRPILDISRVGPAGSIHSNVIDMGQWLRFHLANGAFGGNQLVAEESLEETKIKQISMGGGANYGLGWMLHELDGNRVVEHGGNIQGFAAEVCLFPDNDLAFVLLTNVTSTPLQQLSIGLIGNHLLGELPDPAAIETSKKNAEQWKPLVGNYIADFGPFDDVRFALTLQDGALFVDVPGQTNYELREPDEQGRHFFVLTDAISVSFEFTENGEVSAMRMQQSGMNFDLPREGHEQIPPVALAELSPYLGFFHDEDLGVDIEFRIQYNRLHADVPGQMAFGLEAPDAEGRWAMRTIPNAWIRFEKDEAGQVASIQFSQEGTERTLLRVEKELTTLPTAEQIAKLRNTSTRRAALEQVGGVRIKGTVRVLESGVTGVLETVFLGTDRERSTFDFGKYGTQEMCWTPEAAFSSDPMSGAQEQKGALAAQLRASGISLLSNDWSAFFDDITVVKQVEHKKQPAWRVQLKKEGLPAVTALIDITTGDLLEYTRVIDLEVIHVTEVSTFSIYKDHGGLRLPSKIETKLDQVGTFRIEIDKVELGVELSDDDFTLAHKIASHSDSTGPQDSRKD